MRISISDILLILFIFLGSITQGLWINYLQNETILLLDIPLVLFYLINADKRTPRHPYNKINYIAIILLLWHLVGLETAPNRIWFWQGFIEAVRAYLIFYAIFRFINKRKEIHLVVTTLMASLAFQSLVALYQWRIGPVGLRFLGELYFGWQSSGTFVHPNILAMFLILLIPISYRLFAFIRPKYKYLYGVVFAMAGGAIFASYSRGCWVGLAAAMVIVTGYDVAKKRIFKKKTLGVMALVALIAGVFAIKYGGIVAARFDDAEESLFASRTSSRISLAKDALRIISEHPLLGTGLNNYKLFANPETAGLRIVHNVYLLIAAEMGIPGLLLFLLFFFEVIRSSLKLLKSKDEYLSNLGIAVLTGLGAFVIASIPSPDYRITFVKSHVWLLCGLLMALNKIEYFRLKKMKRQMRLEREKERAALHVNSNTESTQTKDEPITNKSFQEEDFNQCVS